MPIANLPQTIIDCHGHAYVDEKPPEEMITNMEAQNIGRTIIMGLNYENNAKVLSWWRKHPSRFIPGVFADPRDGKRAIDEVDRYHKEGFRIVKLFPNYGYFPDDDALLPFFEAVAARGMMVLTHCGWVWPVPNLPSAAYHSAPDRFEKLLRRFADMPIVFAHMGGLAHWMEAVMLASRQPNAYVDCSPGQGLNVLQKGGQFVTLIPPHKLMWGSDGVLNLLPAYVEALDALGYGPHFEKIFRTNIIGLLTKIGAWDPQ